MNELPVEIERELVSSFVTMVRQWGSLTTDWGFARNAGVEVPDHLIRIIFTLGARVGDFRPSDMAEHLGMTRASLSKALTQLRTTGFVTGEAAPGDRRAVHVALTSKGKEAYAKILEASMEQVRHASVAFSDAEMQVVARFMCSFVSLIDNEPVHILPSDAN